jgi:SAM-dependent methyltransferase
VSGAAIRRGRALAEGNGAAVRFVEASLLDLPYPDGAFAGVLAECVLSTTSKPSALAELTRVLAPGGTLLVTDVTATEAVVAPDPLADVLCLTGAWQPGELEDLATSSGLEIVTAWDETASISALLDRLEARIGLLTTLARDLATSEPLAEGIWGATPIVNPGRIATAFQDARRLVSDGRIGYRAVVARAVAPPRGDGVAKIAAIDGG